MSSQLTIEGVENDEQRAAVVEIIDRPSPLILVIPAVSPSLKPMNPAPPSSSLRSDLLAAFELIARRGAGNYAWAAPLADDPIAFLLDSISDAANLWSVEGSLLSRNRASIALGPISAALAPNPDPAGAVEAFNAHDRLYERRYLHCRMGDCEYVLEVIREVAAH